MEQSQVTTVTEKRTYVRYEPIMRRWRLAAIVLMGLLALESYLLVMALKGNVALAGELAACQPVETENNKH